MLEPLGGILEAVGGHSAFHIALHGLVEVRVAGVADGQAQVVVGVRPVAPDQVAVAAEPGIGCDDGILQRNQRLHHFKNRARAVLPLDGQVEQPVGGILAQRSVVGPTLSAHQHVGVVGGAGDQGEDLTSGGFDGDHAAGFVLQQLFRVGLQFTVEGGGEGFAGHRVYVVLPFGYGLDDVAVVALVVADAFGAAQVLLVGQLHAGFAAGGVEVVVGVGGHVRGVHLGYVAKQVSRGRIHVPALRARLGTQTWETVQFLGNPGVILDGDLLLNGVLAVRNLAGGFQPFAQGFERHAHQLGQCDGVLDVGVLHGHHQVVHRLVGHQQFAVAVYDQPAVGADDGAFFGDAQGCILALILQDLHVKQADEKQQEDRDEQPGEHKLAVVQIHREAALGVNIKYWPSTINSTAATALAPALPRVTRNWSSENTSTKPSHRWKGSISRNA